MNEGIYLLQMAKGLMNMNGLENEQLFFAMMSFIKVLIRIGMKARNSR
jgi:hypothetical protein